MEYYDIIVIGGGASGLFAGGFAAQRGAKTAILEKMSKPGLKLGITGKGRCNLTNTAELKEFINHFNRQGKFLYQPFSIFFRKELLDFLASIGIKTIEERGGRIFPESGSALETAKSIVKWCKNSGVTIKNNSKVSNINFVDDKIEVRTSNNTVYLAKKIIITTGGSSYPRTGSEGDGYIFAKKIGHKITSILPSLIPLIVETSPNFNTAAGLKLKNIKAVVFVENKRKYEEFGELYFLNNSISGPVILSLSRIVVPLLIKNKKIRIDIDLKPALDEKKLNLRLIKEIEENHKKTLYNMLTNILPLKILSLFIEQTTLNSNKICNEISSKERKKIIFTLKNFTFEINDFEDISKAIITAGGVSLADINSNTMQSKLNKNIYFAGEILNFDADTGGFNLQAAFSTGYSAGIHAADQLDDLR